MLKKLREFFSGKGRKKSSRSSGPRRVPTLESRAGTSSRDDSLRPYPRARRKRKSPFKRLLKKVFVYGGVIGGLIVGWLYITLPDIEDLNKFTKAPSILIKSEDGKIIGSFGDIYADYVPFEELPQSLIDAVLATEDRNFYHHFGIDPFGLARAMYVNIQAGQVVQGGSTITQQLAKNVFLTPERSLARKIREMMLAFKLEANFSKREILSIYLNRVYMGAGNYGIDAASRRYFDKSARDLTLSESAMLAGLLKAPSRFAPTSDPARARKRAEQVLLNMKDAGFLDQAQTDRALAELEKSMSGRKQHAQSTFYFADWIMDQLPEYVGIVDVDMVVITTLKPEWQLMAEKAINDVMDKEGIEHEASQAALLSLSPDGAVRAMIGGRSYAESQFNRATQSLRQPGSAFKLFVYLAGLEVGLHPNTLIDDEPISVPIYRGTWEPKNYTGRYLGTITMKEAVTESINTVAVRVAMHAGLNHVIDIAYRLGITSELDPLPSIALGATEVSLLELTTAYAHLAAEGEIVYPYGILEIQTTQGEVIYRRQGSLSGRVLSGSTVGMMNEMLMSVVENGTGRGAAIGRPAAGKTGTTSDYRDAWFMGYTPQLVTGVWVGNDDNHPMKKVTGGMLPARIWRGFMSNALAGSRAPDIPTGGGWFSNPWGDSRELRDSRDPRMEDNRPRGRDVELGTSFWEKLLGAKPENRNKIERVYPGQD